MSLAIASILKEGIYWRLWKLCRKSKKIPINVIEIYRKTRNPVICKIKRISKPGLRVYSNSKELPRVLDDLGIAIISTSKGVMTNLKAKELGIGGEILCHIW
jgi:small subunit ribosomal protein S8